MRPRWQGGPATITLVRHGESMGNLADEAAREAKSDHLDLDDRDADVELSDTGRDQASAVGRWRKDAPEDWQPTLVLSSPYRRAAETARIATDGTGLDVVLDERLSAGQLLGLPLVLAGCWLATRRPPTAAVDEGPVLIPEP